MNRKMMLMLVALTLATLLLLVPFSARMGSASASAASATTLETAEQLYAQGDFALAAELYRQVVDQGYGDGDLYYNLGVAYHGAGDLGRALWSLRHAEALSPRDADIQTALASVRADLDASSAGTVAQSTGLARAMAANAALGIYSRTGRYGADAVGGPGQLAAGQSLQCEHTKQAADTPA